MTFTKFKCTPPRLNLHLDDLSRKILFWIWPLRLNLFNWLIPNGLPFKNISYVLDAYGASIYIAHHLKRMTNNMGQSFREGETFSCSHNTRAF